MTNPSPIDARFSVKISRYHYWVYTVLFLSKIPAIWHVLNLMLLNPPMKYTCGARADTNTCPCADPKWDTSVFTETVQTKFGLICHKKFEIALSETMAYLGMLIGAFTFGLISDKFGRLFAFCMSFLVVGLAGLGVSMSPSMVVFYIFRLLEGAGAGGTIVTGFVLLVEYTGTPYREVISAVYHIPINVGHVLIAGVSYIFRNVFQFQLAISIPPFILVFAYFYVNESPVWLLDNERMEKAVTVMERIVKFNKEDASYVRSELESYNSSKTTAQHAKIQIYHIFKYRKPTINLVCMAYLYFICGMGYYGVSQYISKMSGNIHANIALSATLTIPGTVACTVLLKFVGRKPLLLSTCMGSGVFMIITVLIPSDLEPAWLKVLLACISNCFFFMSFIVVFLYGVELFPTQIRNSALGLMSLLSRAGMMIAPQINALSPHIAGYVFGIMSLVGGFLTFLLPETKNRPLPSSLEDANR